MNRTQFERTLEKAQLKIAVNGKLSQEKLDTYWDEFSGISGITDEIFSKAVCAVSRDSKFFPKCSEIHDELKKLLPNTQIPIFQTEERRKKNPPPVGIRELFKAECEKALKKKG